MKPFFKKSLPHIAAIALFFILSAIYFYPVLLENKTIEQGDIKSSGTWGQDAKEYHKKTGDYAHWSNSMFSGMPTNYTYAPKATNVFHKIGRVLFLNNDQTFGLVFLYMLGFYIFLLAIGCRTPLAIVGAIAYAFVSYNIVIIDAGHILKGLVMATMAPIIGGIMLCYRGKYLWGIIITLIFTGLNVAWEHQQISFYLLLIILILGIVYLIYAIKEKTLPQFFKASAILLVVAALSVTPSLGKLIPTMDYTKETMRGGAVLKNNPDGKPESAGLEIDYAFQWSYGKMETFTLLIPNFYGGSSVYNLGETSEFYKALKTSGNGAVAKQYAKQAPTYWGSDEYKSFTSGPVYAGAIICFLFILGLIIVKGKDKWWLLGATVLSLVLAWGRNFYGFNAFLFEHLPLYNKFRTPEMVLVIANLTMAILAILALKEIVAPSNSPKRGELQVASKKVAPAPLPIGEGLLKPIIISASITGGLCLFFALFGGSMFDFSAMSDANYPDWLVSSLVADRKAMLTGDSWRSFFFIAAAAVLLIIYIKKKFDAKWLILAIGLLIFIDLWAVDKRFLGYDKFVSIKQAKEFAMTDIDKMILQDTTHYRVLNFSTNTFNESGTSAFHKSVGGYSPAKLRRYQDIIDYCFSRNKINEIMNEIFTAQGDLSKIDANKFSVLNMLNAKYLIMPTKNGAIPLQNIYAFGNAWFVYSIKWVNSPDEEILAISNVNLKNTAVIDKNWENSINAKELTNNLTEITPFIELKEYKSPGHLIFESYNENNQLAVFSEVYYKTWKAYIDNEEVPLVRVNYILRGLQVPAGKHTIELICKDELIIKSAKIALVASWCVGLILSGLIGLIIYRKVRKD